MDDYLKDRAELARFGDPIALQQAREEEMRLSADDQCAGVAAVEYGRELRCNPKAAHAGECEL